MSTTTCVVGAGTCAQHGTLRTKVTKQLESCLTLCVMSWMCYSTSAAKTMASVMMDMLMGATTPKRWPRVMWVLLVDGKTLYLQLVQVPEGTLLYEEAPSRPDCPHTGQLALPETSSDVLAMEECADDESSTQRLPF